MYILAIFLRQDSLLFLCFPFVILLVPIYSVQANRACKSKDNISQYRINANDD